MISITQLFEMSRLTANLDYIRQRNNSTQPNIIPKENIKNIAGEGRKLPKLKGTVYKRLAAAVGRKLQTKKAMEQKKLRSNVPKFKVVKAA